MKRSVGRFACLVALTLVLPSASPLEAGRWPLRKKCLVLGATVAGAALLSTTQVLQHGAIHHPLGPAKPDNGTLPSQPIEVPAALAATNFTERVPLNITLPERLVFLNLTGPAAPAPMESKAEPATRAQDEATRVDALVLAAQQAFSASLCPGELQHSLQARSAHGEKRIRKVWTVEQADAWYRNKTQELSSQDEVRNYQERIAGSLETLNASACMVLRKYRDSSKPYPYKRSRLKDRILNLRRLQAQFLDDEMQYNRDVSTAFGFAREQAALGHSGWEEAPGTLPYSVRLGVCDAEWDKLEGFANSLLDHMAPILLEMMPGNSTAAARDRRRWHFKLGW